MESMNSCVDGIQQPMPDKLLQDANIEVSPKGANRIGPEDGISGKMA